MVNNTTIQSRRTFAIISHPDAGKTTLTEALLLTGNVIQTAGTVKGKKSGKHATSDWMEMEQKRGISVTTSVMQFPYKTAQFNLLDTPGHEDFSEDTYRTLTAVDTALMVIDVAKGVEARTIKLMEVCRLRDTPIVTFINKLDREGQCPIALLDEIESVLNIKCVPMTWPIGSGKRFKGVIDTVKQCVYVFHGKEKMTCLPTLDKDTLIEHFGEDVVEEALESLELVQGAGEQFDLTEFRAGRQTPVYFGSAINHFGITDILDALVQYGAPPQPRVTMTGEDIHPESSDFSGVVFKIQANMDPMHRDRMAFMRICSGEYRKGMKMYHVRKEKYQIVNNAVTFIAGDRVLAEQAYPGDIIGIHNHGGIQIGDTFTQGKHFKFKGVPNFAPELFKAVRPKDPLKMKQLMKGLVQLSEEGATQVFRPLDTNQVVLGAVGSLQFDVVAERLKSEYKVECIYDAIAVSTARWLSGDDAQIALMKDRLSANCAVDGEGCLAYLAPSRVNLSLTQERYDKVKFLDIRE